MIEYEAENWWAVSFHFRGSVIPRIAVRASVATLIGLLAATLFHFDERFAIPTLLHTLVGLVLGLLLVFRTNASYDRWWEGRKFLGTIINRSRDLMRQIATYIPDEELAGESERKRLARYLGAMYRLCCQSLREEDDLDALEGYLSDKEREALTARSFRANTVATWIAARLAAQASKRRVSDRLVAAMDANLTAINDAVGACHRILHTPVPLAYAQHTKLFVSLFCFTVPFAIVREMTWFTPFASALLTFAFFGIDEIGVEIEDPFGFDPNDLPMEDIGDAIDASTVEIADCASAVPDLAEPAPVDEPA